MCGSDYCGTCTPAAEVTAFAEGRLHTAPRFGDNAQCRVATKIRSHLLANLITAQDMRALEFPEFYKQREVSGHLARFVRRAEPRFNLLLKVIPAFSQHVAEHPFVFNTDRQGSRRRKQRANSRKSWRKGRIEAFVKQNGDSALREMHDFLGFSVPWWKQPQAAPISVADKLGVAHLLNEPAVVRKLEHA